MLEEITQFILNYDNPSEKVWTEFVISKHLEYGTYVLLRDKEDKIIAFVGLNINNKVAEVLRTVVRPDFRHKRILKLLVLMSKQKFPFLESFYFERDKYPNKMQKLYNIEKFLKR